MARKKAAEDEEAKEVTQESVAIPIGHVQNLALQLHMLLQSRQVPVAVYTPAEYSAAVRNIDLREVEGVTEDLARNWDAIRQNIPVIADQNLTTFQVIGSLRLVVENVLTHYSKHIQAALEEIGVPYEVFLQTPGMVEMVAVMLIAMRAADRASRATHIVVPASAIQH